MPDLFMVFDVESVGLHGEGFAVGYVVVRPDGQEIHAARYSCPPSRAWGNKDGEEWARQNVPAFEHTHGHPEFVRSAFWVDWSHWEAQGAVLVADCSWPVEARFLIEAVKDALDPEWGAGVEDRTWQGPYPLYDVSTAMLMAGRDPLATYGRLPNELPEHDPLADARQSARLWLECLTVMWKDEDAEH